MERRTVAGSTGSVADRFSTLVARGLLTLPVPGGGCTFQRHRALADLGAADLAVARLAEGHADALAILAEAGCDPPPGRLGVWASDPPDGRVVAHRTTAGWRLEGTKRWCSGARLLDAALVTAHAEDGYRLFAVDLSLPGVRTDLGVWQAAGMQASATGDVTFEGIIVEPTGAVGGPGWYLDRRGFWAGGIDVAACWYGGARGATELLADRLRRRDDAHGFAILGTATALGHAMASQLIVAGDALDAGIDGIALRNLAWQVRSAVEHLCLSLVPELQRGLGAGQLARHRRTADLLADLPVYLRQHHGAHDLEALGRAVVGQ